MIDLTLATRPGLPDALRVLVDALPRDAWPGDPRFGALVRFWLDRHLAFRDIIATLQRDAERLLDRHLDAAAYGTRLRRLGGHFVQDLHGHHMIEDEHYFPALAALEPRIAAGFTILDADHHALDARIDGFVKGANGILQRLDDPVALASRTGRFRDDLAALDRLLNRHLVDEEDLIVPIILTHGEGALP